MKEIVMEQTLQYLHASGVDVTYLLQVGEHKAVPNTEIRYLLFHETNTTSYEEDLEQRKDQPSS